MKIDSFFSIFDCVVNGIAPGVASRDIRNNYTINAVRILLDCNRHFHLASFQFVRLQYIFVYYLLLFLLLEGL